MLKKWLDVEGPVMGFLEKTGQLIELSMLWILGCLPVVTVGTSTAALYYAVMKAVRRGRGRAVSEFWRRYREDLGRSIAAWLPLLAVGALLGSDIVILRGQDRPLHTGAVIVLAALLAALAVYVGPVLSRFSVKVGQVWRLAFVMAVRFWYWTAAILVLAGLVGTLQFYVLPWPTAAILPGAGCLAATFPIEKALRCYMPPKEEGDDAWYYDS